MVAPLALPKPIVNTFISFSCKFSAISIARPSCSSPSVITTIALFVGEDSEFEEGFEHSGFFALIDQEGYIRCRIDENENPIIYYNGLDDDGIQMIKEDIKLLL